MYKGGNGRPKLKQRAKERRPLQGFGLDFGMLLAPEGRCFIAPSFTTGRFWLAEKNEYETWELGI
jgi:hypothetical protein